MGLVQIDGDEVSLFADFEGPDLILPAEGGGTVSSGHSENLRRRTDERVTLDHFMELGHLVHLGEEVKIVVAGAAVGSQSDFDAGREHAGNGGDSRGQFHVAFRIMGNLYPSSCQELDFLRFQPHRMGA